MVMLIFFLGGARPGSKPDTTKKIATVLVKVSSWGHFAGGNPETQRGRSQRAKAKEPNTSPENWWFQWNWWFGRWKFLLKTVFFSTGHVIFFGGVIKEANLKMELSTEPLRDNQWVALEDSYRHLWACFFNQDLGAAHINFYSASCKWYKCVYIWSV